MLGMNRLNLNPFSFRIQLHFSFSHVKRLVLDTGFVQESLVALFEGLDLPSQLFVVILDLVFTVFLCILNLHFQVPNPVNVLFKVTFRDQHLLTPRYNVGPRCPLRARYFHIKHHHQPILRCAEETLVTA
ncbi:hypothetical protein KC19_6G141000 [Ceratodon purpureus]|uniref:Uncharacterized protein n=1 Tax=Ceratodon purpureus TaxID=3225 RepID=A0A8T0HEE2_CERPU|nr:hypothetical protein KC19_6G141000 [Ceratodon purpureus]